jgi:hypothetical protein
VLEEQQIEAQQSLNELFNTHLLPYKLYARKVERIGMAEYIVRFYDSRLRSVNISCRRGQSFKDVFRAAVLESFRGSLSRKHAA